MKRVGISLLVIRNVRIRTVVFSAFVNVYLCSAANAIAIVSRHTGCYIYLRHAGVNFGIYAMRTLSRWLLLLGLIGCGLYLKPAISKSGLYFKPAQTKP